MKTETEVTLKRWNYWKRPEKQFIKLYPLCTIQSKYLPLKQFQGLVCLLLNGPNKIISGSLHYNWKWAYYNGHYISLSIDLSRSYWLDEISIL